MRQSFRARERKLRGLWDRVGTVKKRAPRIGERRRRVGATSSPSGSGVKKSVRELRAPGSGSVVASLLHSRLLTKRPSASGNRSLCRAHLPRTAQSEEECGCHAAEVQVDRIIADGGTSTAPRGDPAHIPWCSACPLHLEDRRGPSGHPGAIARLRRRGVAVCLLLWQSPHTLPACPGSSVG